MVFEKKPGLSRIDVKVRPDEPILGWNSFYQLKFMEGKLPKVQVMLEIDIEFGALADISGYKDEKTLQEAGKIFEKIFQGFSREQWDRVGFILSVEKDQLGDIEPQLKLKHLLKLDSI